MTINYPINFRSELSVVVSKVDVSLLFSSLTFLSFILFINILNIYKYYLFINIILIYKE